MSLASLFYFDATKDQAVGSLVQIPASGLTVDLYKPGCRVKTGGIFGPGLGTVTVNDVGAFAAADNVIRFDSTLSALGSVDALLSRTSIRINFSAVTTLSVGDLLTTTTTRPDIYLGNRVAAGEEGALNGTRTGVGVITTSSRGIVLGWVDRTDPWVSVSGGGTTWTGYPGFAVARRFVTDAPFERKADDFAAGSSTGGIQEALDDLPTLGGKVVLSAATTYTLSVAVTHPVNTEGPITIEGGGWSTVLSLTGASNEGLSLTGIAGVTSPGVILRNFKVKSNTTGVSAAGIHLTGLAVVKCENLWIDGNAKMTNGIQFTGTQQGEISGGFIQNCPTGLRLEGSGAVASNGIDVHGVSFANTGTNIAVTLADSTMIHHNHLTSAPIGIDFSGASSGINSILVNHIEGHTTAGVRAATGTAHIIGNSFFTGAAGTDVSLTGGSNHVVLSNLFNGIVNFGAGADQIGLLNNRFTNTSSLVDNSTNVTKLGNTGSSPSFGAILKDSIKTTSRATVAGHIIEALANPAVSGAWGIRVGGAGAAQDIYLVLGTEAIVGSTSGGSIRVMSAVGGTEWGKFDANGIHARVVATASLPAAGAANDGLIIIEDVAAGDRNLIIYAGGQRFRIDGGVAF